ncbi:hypothetical protein [Sphingomonas jeddahensis]|uniref:Uncharacterized protein n=1 Tax=Sphingomonas jeddahensis TaxID=1915074 RepID=A0A1V2EYF2_9SPHN|nr:hypothetical protein [Sphingomonas jeddahensis]ONF97209.1 hypothetical protein SPHI_06460 [Sphingomonas jeddahensis]
MSAQARFNEGPADSVNSVTLRMAIAHPMPAANAVHLMQQDARDRLNSNNDAPTPASGMPLHAVVTVPGVIVGAACVLPLTVVAFSLTRLARGQIRGLGADAVGTARGVWRATGAAIDALTDRSSRR